MHKKHVHFDPHTKTKSISIPHTKLDSISIQTLVSSRLRSSLWKQFSFHGLRQKNKLLSFQTLNQVISTPAQIQVNSDPYTEIEFMLTTHTTKSISMSTLKPCHFRPVLFFVLYVRLHVAVIHSNNQTYTSTKLY